MPVPTRYTISGNIYDEYNSPLASAYIKAYEVALRNEKLIASVTTDTKGRYSLSFNGALVHTEYKAPDIYIAVLKQGESEIVGKSSVYFNIKPETEINYRIGNATILPINEFDRLVTLLSPILTQSNLDFDQLEENNDNKDISFLSGETGIKSEKISFLNIAFTLSKNSSIAADIFYGLFYMGLPTVLNEILMIKSASIKQALLQAIDQNVISSKWVKQLGEIFKRFNYLAVNKILAGNDEQSVAFKNLLGTALTQREQMTFLKTFIENEGNSGIFWDELGKQDGFLGLKVKKAKQLVFETFTDVQLAEYLFKVYARND